MSIGTSAFIFLAKRWQLVINLFFGVYLIILVLGTLAIRSAFTRDSWYLWAYTSGLLSGKIALFVYTLTMFPGITKRLELDLPVVNILRMFRRYLGILMYLFVLVHVGVIAGPRLLNGVLWPESLFEQLGLLATVLLFWLFITSSDWAVKTLGIWWFRLHTLTYPALGLMLLHTSLQRVSIWSVMAATTIILEVLAIIYSFLRRYDLW